MEEVYAALRMYTCAEQTTLLGKYDIHSGVVGETTFRIMYPARAYKTLVVLVIFYLTLTVYGRTSVLFIKCVLWIEPFPVRFLTLNPYEFICKYKVSV